MRRIAQLSPLAIGIIIANCQSAQAGMPSVGLTEIARLKFEAISFFGAGLLLSAGGIQFLWNWLRRDFTSLPRLSYGKACGLVVLWGLLFAVVLTMISGARELMTPGAWEKNGATYKLRDERPEVSIPLESDLRTSRREHLLMLAGMLTRFAVGHDGAYPRNISASEIPVDYWQVPGYGELPYFLVAGRTTSDGDMPLAFEPAIDERPVLALLANGKIEELPFEEILQRLASKE